MPRRHVLVAALGVTAGLALVLFEPLFLGRSTLAFDDRDPRLDARPWAEPTFDATTPINPVTPDLNSFVLPGLMRVQGMLARDELALRDDSQLLGFDFAANLAWPLLSPIGWMLIGLEPVDAIDWMLALHTLIAALLALRTARLLGASLPAAALAAIGFALSAWMYTRWHEGLIVYATAWWPGILGALEWLGRGRVRRAVLEGAAFTALSAVSGFPQVTAYMLAGAGVLALLDPRTRGPRRAGAAGIAALVGLSIAAPQWLLSAQAYATSQRSSETTRTATVMRGLPPAALAGLALPEFFGRPSDFARPGAPRMEEWLPQRRWIADPTHSQNSSGELTIYAGLLPLLLLGVAWRRDGGGAQRRLTIVAWLAVLGCIVWPWLARAAPALSVLGAGNVKRALVLWNGCVPFAVALAFDAWRAREARLPLARFALLLVVLCALPVVVRRFDDPDAGAFAADLVRQCKVQAPLLCAALAALALARRGRWLAWLPAAVLLVDLGLAARAFNPYPVQLPQWRRTPALDALAARPGRVAVLGGVNVLPPPPAAIHGIRCVHGMLPMVPLRAAELLACVEGPLLNPAEPRIARPFQAPASVTHPILDLLGVDTVVVGDARLAAALDLPLVLRSDAEAIGAFACATALPRAFLATGAEVVADAGARLARLASRDFDPRATALLEEAPPFALPARGAIRAVELERIDATRIDVSANAAEPGIVVVSEGWDPAWTATVDGAEARVLIVDHALLGVATPAGSHVVTLRYRPPGLRASIVVAGAALLASCVLAVSALRGRR